jgi:hypothetical protein
MYKVLVLANCSNHILFLHVMESTRLRHLASCNTNSQLVDMVTISSMRISRTIGDEKDDEC